VLVTLGGGDPDNVTMQVVQALKQINIEGLEAKIVVGPANPNLQALNEEIGNQANLQIITNAANMPELIAWADIAVSAGGSTCWEMALLGLPNIIIHFAENQRPIAEKLHESGAAMSLGWCHELSHDHLVDKINDVLHSKEIRKKYSETSRNIVDGLGPSRVIQAFFQHVHKEDK
jgi:spore coat polysaccharide biosynthesis predicted glycosyltransferase SpsG